MLGAIERKLTSLIGDGLADRAHLSVVAAPGSTAAIAAAHARLTVSVAEAAPRQAFERGFVTDLKTAGGLASRRVLPLSFRARLDFRHQPGDNSDAELAAARSLLLDDVALAAHLLNADVVRSGKGFANGAADPGYRVLSFELDKAVVDRDVMNQSLTAAVEYLGTAEIWPPGVTQPEGAIAAVETLMAPLPITLRPVKQEVVQGGTARIAVSALPKTTKTRGPIQLAVRVVSDLPPAQRGQITNGEAGLETGLRLIATAAPETVIEYSAPAGNLGGTRVEFVAVHLATADKKKGDFLGSTAIQLLPKKP